MPEPTTEDRRTAADAGFFGHLAGFLSSQAGYLKARFQLAGLETKEALVHYAIIAVLAIAALVVVVFGYIFLMFALVFGIAALIGEQHVWWLTLVIALLHFGAAVGALLMAKSKLAAPMFTATLYEFKKDQEWLSTTTVKTELIAEINRARSRATAHRRALADDLQVGEKFKENIARHRTGWLGGAILTGLLITKVPPRTKQITVDRTGKAIGQKELAKAGKAGFFLAIIKLLVDVTKPIIMAWATKRLGQAVAVGKQVKDKVERVEQKT